MSCPSLKLFGTDGIRGRVNTAPMTTETAMRTGRAIAAVLLSRQSSPGPVLVGRDTRNSGEMLEFAVVSGLLSAGASVISLGVIPTPAVAFLTRTSDASAGVMITASHNPYEDNGLKIFGHDGFKLPDNVESEVERHILGLSEETPLAAPANIGTFSVCPDAVDRYLEFAKSSSPGLDLHGMKVVLDCGNGAAYLTAPRLFRDLGAEVILLGTSPDGKNINHDCGALHTDKAGQIVRDHGADLGVSLDGDADRVIFTDATGSEVSGDRILAMCAIQLKEQGKLRQDTLVVTVMSNLGLVEAMKHHGIRVETTAVGDRHVLERMKSHDFNFGGENSGHLIFSDHATTGDGIISALQVLRMMKNRAESLAGLASVMEEYPARLVNLAIPCKPPLACLPGLQALMAEATAAFGDVGRHLIRYSGTENKIRVLVEHRDAAKCQAWTDRFVAAIRAEIS